MAKTTPTTKTSVTAAAAKPRKPRVSKKANDTLQVNMLQSADESLDQLMAELGVPSGGAPDEVIERAEPEVLADAAVIEALDANEVLPEPEAIDPLTQLANAVAADAPAPESIDPEDEAEDDEPEVEAGDDAAKVKKVKAAPKPRKHYSDQTERLRDNLGANLSSYTVLTMDDTEMDEAALKKCMDDTLALIKAMNKKEQKWAVKFIEFLAGKKTSLSEVTHRILKVMDRDGVLTMGNEGNVFKDLISKPYSPGAARAMGGNNIGMLKDLQVIIPGEAKNTYVPNPASLLLATAKSKLTAVAA